MHNQRITTKKRLVDFFIEQHHFKQLKTCVITSSTQMGVENPTLKLTPTITNTNIFVGTKPNTIHSKWRVKQNTGNGDCRFSDRFFQ